MRILVLLRGPPGSGKSYFVQKEGLTPFTVSSDTLRLLKSSPVLTLDKKTAISASNDKEVWRSLYDLVEKRMQNGDFTVVDATHCRKEYLSKYHDLCGTYRYRCFVVDFTDLSLEECKKNNLNREEYKRVPDYVVAKFYSFGKKKSELPGSWAKVIKPQDLSKNIQWRITDVSKYKKIHYIGDIQGCFTVLQSYFDSYKMQEDHLYIFVGDLLDRGIENAKVLEFFFQIYEKENVVIIEGNHDSHLWQWANGMKVKSGEFNKKTIPEITKDKSEQEIEDLKKKIRVFCRSFHQLHYHSYHSKEIIVTHGGLSCIPPNLSLVSQQELINGTGDFEDNIDDYFYKNTSENQYQIHGHRNPFLLPCQVNSRSFNLECGVEYGGYLRVVTLDENGFKVVEIKNRISKYVDKDLLTGGLEDLNVVLIAQLRKSKYVQEKKLKEGDISSFNFTEQAFFRSVWNSQTIKARGLFVNTKTFRVAARSYDKFFNMDEVPATEMTFLQSSLKFPVQTFVKENGYLGVASGIFIEGSFSLLACSKSTNEGKFAEEFKKLLIKHISNLNISESNLAEDLWKRNVSLVFEVINPEFDPHIIQYKEPVLILLDVIENKLTSFVRYDQKQREELAQKYNLKFKRLFKVLNNWDEFAKWHAEVTDTKFQVDNEYVEGFVLEDASNFMFKLKLNYYRMWKQARSIKERLVKGSKVNTKELEPELKEFVNWLQTLDRTDLKADIITLRNNFQIQQRTKDEVLEELTE